MGVSALILVLDQWSELIFCADAEADLAVPIEAEMSEDTADDDISSRYVNPLLS